MFGQATIDTIAHAIQLAVTPVFLLAGVSGLLGVMTHRLARIVDRSRVLHARLAGDGAGQDDDVRAEIAVLHQRVMVVNFSISLGTICALLICTVVAVIFLGSFMAINVAMPIALCFVTGMACLIGALLGFLREIYLATVRVPIRH